MCVLIFVLMLSTLTPYVMIFANGFAEGYEAAMKKDGGAKATAAVEREADALAGAKTLSLIPCSMSSTKAEMHTGSEHGDVRIWPFMMSVDIDDDSVGMAPAVDGVVTMLLLALMVAVIVVFVKLIVNVNRQRVFIWNNVRLLRLVGGGLLLMSLLGGVTGVTQAASVVDTLQLEGYMVNYVDYFQIGDMVVGLAALVFAEILAIGMKMKEEQDLTI